MPLMETQAGYLVGEEVSVDYQGRRERATIIGDGFEAWQVRVQYKGTGRVGICHVAFIHRLPEFKGDPWLADVEEES